MDTHVQGPAAVTGPITRKGEGCYHVMGTERDMCGPGDPLKYLSVLPRYIVSVSGHA